MSTPAIVPIASATAVGLGDELLAIATHAKVGVKGSYLPRLGFEAAVMTGGFLLARRPSAFKQVAAGAEVGAAALLGENLAYILTGTEKL